MAQSRMLDDIEIGEPLHLDHRSQRTFDVLVREALVEGELPTPSLTERGRAALYSGEIPDGEDIT